MDALRAALRSNIKDLAENLLGRPNQAASSKRELRWGRKGSFRVTVEGSKAGAWADFEAGERGDPIRLIQHARHCGFPEAVSWGASWAGIDIGVSAQPEDEALRQARQSQRDRERATAERGATADRNRQIRIAQFIASHATEIKPDGLVDRYLTHIRSIPRPEAGWPSAVRYLPAWGKLPAAAAFLATDASSKVCGVQRVELDPDGQKIRKRSRGAFADTGALVRLPGPADGPLLVAEGPETGLSVWAATGHETWIAVGSLSRVALPKNRIVVVCRDDDPEDSPADKAFERTLSHWRMAEVDVVIAQPWHERRFDRSDFNDLIQAGGTDAVLQRIEAALHPTLPSAMRRRVTVEEGRQRTKEAVGRFFDAVRDGADSSLAMGMRVDVGVGKSAMAREATARLLAAMRAKGDERSIVFAVPTHVLGSEAINDFHALPLVRERSLIAAQWRGRTAADPQRPGAAMCLEAERVQAAQMAGADVEKSCCRKELQDGTVATCPMFHACGYQRQKAQNADVTFVAHEAMFSAKPAAVGEVAAVILDESFWPAGLEGVDGGIVLTLETLGLAPSLPGLDGQRQRYLRTLAMDVMRSALDGPVNRQAFLAAGLTKDMAMEGHALEWRLHTPPDLHPGMAQEAYKAAARTSEPNRTARRLARFWKALATLLDDDGPEQSGWLELDVAHIAEGDARIIRMRGRKTIKEGWNAPTLMIDANFQRDLARHFFPAAEVIADIAVTAPHQRIVQIEGRSNSKRRLVEDPMASEVENHRRAKHRHELAGTIQKIARGYPGKGLVVSQLAVEDWLTEHGALPPSIDLAHFNKVAGRDAWGPKQGQGGVDFLIVVGRVMPKPTDVEAMAEAISGRAVDRIKGGFLRVQASREKAGSYAVAAEAPRHPDALCEAIRQHVCEGEIIQAVGRARGVNRTADNPVDIYVLTDVPISLPVDRLVPAVALDPSPLDEMLAAGGIAFMSSACAAQAYPGLWRTPSAAKSALFRAEKWGAKPYIYIKDGHAPHFRRVEFQQAGQGKRVASAIVDMLKVPDPRQHLEALLGELAAFKVLKDQPVQESSALAQPRVVSSPGKLSRPPRTPPAPCRVPFWQAPPDLPPTPPLWTPPLWMLGNVSDGRGANPGFPGDAGLQL